PEVGPKWRSHDYDRAFPEFHRRRVGGPHNGRLFREPQPRRPGRCDRLLPAIWPRRRAACRRRGAARLRAVVEDPRAAARRRAAPGRGSAGSAQGRHRARHDPGGGQGYGRDARRRAGGGRHRVLTPFNFPLAIPTWKMFPALLCGNAVIFKPAEDVPHTAHLLVEILLEAGLPPEVVQLIHGEGSVVGKAMVEHAEVPVISFTGSTETGSIIGATCGKMHKRLSLEMGGKNAMIVMDDSDLDLALDGVLWGAFGTTGQRCTATSRLIVHEKVHAKLGKR